MTTYIAEELSEFIVRPLKVRGLTKLLDSFAHAELIAASYFECVDLVIFELFFVHLAPFEFELFKKHDLLPSGSIDDARGFHNENKASPEFAEYIYSKYPFLQVRLTRFVNNCIDYFNEILGFVKDNELDINAQFNCDIFSKLKTIKPFQGDLHRGNRSTTFLSVSEQTLVFKNRNSDVDKKYYKLLQSLGIYDQVPKIIVSEGYSIIEFIKAEKVEDRAVAHDYFYKFGKIALISYLMSSEDLFSENVIVRDGLPMLIDLECVISNSRPNIAQTPINEIIDTFVLKSGIFPFEFDFKRIFPVSPLVKTAKEYSKGNSTVSEIGEEDVAEHGKLFKFLPIFGNDNLPVHSYKSDFIKGFEDAAHSKKVWKMCEEFLQSVLSNRYLYKNPEYIFFDEATNALDANNEKVIMENLDRFFKGKTVVVVAHRLSTVRNADKIVVLHQGEIVEEGTHEQLAGRRGYYYELVKNQLELGN